MVAKRHVPVLGWYLLILTYGLLGLSQLIAAEPLSYNRDIRPILADRCFKCHGPDAGSREGNLRLDLREHAVKALSVGKPEASSVLARITSQSDDERMPPAETGPPLRNEQIAALQQWIAEGAKYEAHWSLLPLKPLRAATKDQPPPGIDTFVSVRLAKVGQQLAPVADKATLLRRVTLDLTGLPPTIAELDAFLADESPQAYEAAVDRLLASPRYGEHMAVEWLDLARYADTHGYGVDSYRIMWQWRDWVIKALNNNMPFDQFTIEQLAGDLLPKPTQDQLIATAFNRNHPIQLESGSPEEEFRVETVVDRASTTATVWLGMTIGCARCHDHKYDPVSQEDFYRFYAFFNNVDEKGVPSVYGDVNSHRGNHGPTLPTPEHGMLPEQNSNTPVIPSVMVMREMPTPRATQLLKRGAYDQPVGQKLVPGIPRALGSITANQRPNRLTLAKWLVSRSNPLTARVTVNRYWQHFFGTGLVATSDDFGLQGSLPSHPELLDWLAEKFIALKWDVKKLHREIVTSATYRQESRVTPWQLEHDPRNRLLGRGPSQRFTAEMIRDAALFSSGMLVEKVGGPPVRPFQPPGLWAEANYLSETIYVPDTGEGRYRRSLYTYWRRSVPPPDLDAFDAPSRDVCVGRRATTSTPLQALVLLNEPTRQAAARKLAEGLSDKDPLTAQITAAFRLILARTPNAKEVAALEQLYNTVLTEFSANPVSATSLLTTAGGALPSAEQLPALAARTLMVRVILNLDEAITKR
jgi:mono/diheme cytochrome c family protein